MRSDGDSERERLSQQRFIAQVTRELKSTEMLPLFMRKEHGKGWQAVYCALIPNDLVEESLSDTSWDLLKGDGLPGAVKWDEGGISHVRYLRFGDDDGVEPLVFYRHFYGLREPYLEVSEEFRHFHDLYYDKKVDRYSKFDGAGDEQVVITCGADWANIRLHEIRQFLAIKEMHLAVMFDCVEKSEHSLEALSLEENTQQVREPLLHYCLAYADMSGLRDCASMSRLLGKRLIQPLAKEKSGFWGFSEERPKAYQSFIIDVDDDGQEIEIVADHDRLNNYFNGNPGAQNYLTPVFFRRAVLDKYYQQPSKYNVDDGYLRCVGLWGMTIDNAHDDYVTAWLGDLGRDLPEVEQRHWRVYNVPPVGGPSEVAIRRQLLNQMVSSRRPEHEFRASYHALVHCCSERLGWQILLPLGANDAHFLEGIRPPASEEQREFDEQVLALTKVVVDSLNEVEIIKRIPVAEREGLKGSIARLEKLLQIQGAAGFQDHIDFLRDLQNLRSSGVAHRKGSTFAKLAKRLGLEEKPLPDVFRDILESAIRFLEFLNEIVARGSLSGNQG